MREIGLKEVREGARAFYDAGRLTAQMPGSARPCVYRTVDGKYGCAVGAALTDDEVASFRAWDVNLGGSASSMSYQAERAGILRIKPDEMDDVRYVQMIHDYWCNSTGVNVLGEERRLVAERAFLLAIDPGHVIPTVANSADSMITKLWNNALTNEELDSLSAPAPAGS